MAGNDVVDHHSEVPSRHVTHRPELLLSSERLVDLGADSVKVPIHAGRGIPAHQATPLLDRTRVEAVDADLLECGPELLVAQVPRNEVPGLVIMEIGYAVNHTDAFSMAARGSGLANGFCHMLPWPENWVAKAFASSSIDSPRSQLT
jgi:hypothetical protein